MVTISRHSSRGRTPNGKPNPIDVHVGARMRLRRMLLGKSQDWMGAQLGLTFQQVQKYERGANRMGSSRLFDVARVLDVPVSFFFDAMPADVSAMTPSAMSGTVVEPAAFTPAADPMYQRETLELVKSYYAITNPAVRAQVHDLAKILAKSSTPTLAAE